MYVCVLHVSSVCVMYVIVPVSVLYVQLFHVMYVQLLFGLVLFYAVGHIYIVCRAVGCPPPLPISHGKYLGR
jgi:hypothetical protein